MHLIIEGNGEQETEIGKYAEDKGFFDSLHITSWADNPMSYVEFFDVACLLAVGKVSILPCWSICC